MKQKEVMSIMKEEQEVIPIKILIQKKHIWIITKEKQLSYIKEFDRLKKKMIYKDI